MAEKLSNVSGKNAEFLPPYADIGIKKQLSDAEKVELLTTKWLTAHKFEFPERYLKIFTDFNVDYRL